MEFGHKETEIGAAVSHVAEAKFDFLLTDEI